MFEHTTESGPLCGTPVVVAFSSPFSITPAFRYFLIKFNWLCYGLLNGSVQRCWYAQWSFLSIAFWYIYRNSIAVTPLFILKFIHNTLLSIDSIFRLRSYPFCPLDFWLMYYFDDNDLYYKSFQSFGFYPYYDII